MVHRLNDSTANGRVLARSDRLRLSMDDVRYGGKSKSIKKVVIKGRRRGGLNDLPEEADTRTDDENADDAAWKALEDASDGFWLDDEGSLDDLIF